MNFGKAQRGVKLWTWSRKQSSVFNWLRSWVKRTTRNPCFWRTPVAKTVKSAWNCAGAPGFPWRCSTALPRQTPRRRSTTFGKCFAAWSWKGSPVSSTGPGTKASPPVCGTWSSGKAGRPPACSGTVARFWKKAAAPTGPWY